MHPQGPDENPEPLIQSFSLHRHQWLRFDQRARGARAGQRSEATLAPEAGASRPQGCAPWTARTIPLGMRSRSPLLPNRHLLRHQMAPVRQFRRQRICGVSEASSPADRPRSGRQDRAQGCASQSHWVRLGAHAIYYGWIYRTFATSKVLRLHNFLKPDFARYPQALVDGRQYIRFGFDDTGFVFSQQ